MNTAPILRGREVNFRDGYEDLQLMARTFWQSRMTVDGIVPPLPEIIHPIQLLKESANES